MKKYVALVFIFVLVQLTLPAPSYAAFPVALRSMTVPLAYSDGIDTGASKNLSTRELVHVKSKKKKPVYLKSTAIYLALISFFFGGLGLHRFYLGYTVEGIFELLGIGCLAAGIAIFSSVIFGGPFWIILLSLLLIILWFGSWIIQLVDLGAIIINQLPPKNGVFTKKKRKIRKERLGWDTQ